MPRYGLNGVAVRFQSGIKALAGVDLELAAGELLVVLGVTGAGKTTLLRTIAGLQKPDSGAILEDGRDITALPPHARDMAMVFQNFSLYPGLTVGGNLAFPLQAKALALPAQEIQSRVRQTAERLGLADKLHRRPEQLSGGELQRVAIGRALVRRPKLFLFDEPLASLDAKLRERMVSEIRSLQRAQGCGMIYVTHDHVEAMSLADRIAVLDQGRVLQIGTPDEIYRHPAESRVARMLGRPGINLLTSEEAGRLGLPLPGAGPGAGGKFAGIRPESWRVTADPKGPAVATLVEQLGPMLAIVLDVQGITLRVAAPPYLRVKPGDRFRLGVDPSEILAFEK